MPRLQRPDKYIGPDVDTIARVSRSRAPTTADYRRPENNKYYEISTIWMDETTDTPYILVDITANVATWKTFGSPSTSIVSTLTGDTAITVSPDATGDIDLSGVVVANATNAKPLYVDEDAVNNKLNFQVQVASDITGAPSDKNDAGICSFSDTQFVVDANGYVTLVGGTNPPPQTLTGDDGVSVGPNGSGNIDLLGVTVVNGTNGQALYTDGDTASNKIDFEIQLSADRTGAPADSKDAGVCSFDDTAFTVDANGYVTLKGGVGPAVDAINVDSNTGPGTDPVVPDGTGTLTMSGAAVAAHSVPIETHSRAANALNIEVQVSKELSAAPGDTDEAGICSFDSSGFSVDSDGHVTSKAPPNNLRTTHLFEDYISGTSAPLLYQFEFPAWGGVSASLGAVAGHPGFLTLNNGAMVGTTDLYSNIGTRRYTIPLGSGEIVYRIWGKSNTNPSGGSESFVFGLMDKYIAEPATNYIWIRAVNGTANLLAENYDGTLTQTDTGVAVDTDWHLFEIVVNAAGSSVDFNIDGTTVATHTTNIPTSDIAGCVNLNYDGSFWLDVMELIITPTGDRA